jgi:hypothetical protein
MVAEGIINGTLILPSGSSGCNLVTCGALGKARVDLEGA